MSQRLDRPAGPSNRLLREKSPYLLQHAHNPVDWRPWGEEAFAAAREQDKPVFLSVGYSTCHWCHVMAHESFEDPEVARLLNDWFICVKVDREERPDVDGLYMTVCQLLTGSGGWPLSIFMDAEQRPFFAATYIPKISRFGRAGMLELLPRLEEIWRTRRGDIQRSAEGIVNHLEQFVSGDLMRASEMSGEGGVLEPKHLGQAFKELADRFDDEHGGFGGAPKFPSPHNLLFLLQVHRRGGHAVALEMVEKTLMAMRLGGLFDQLGGGFHRYSTDDHWLLPHFEKMLYDQAMLAMAYLEAYDITKKPLYGDTARAVFDYLLRDMQDPGGAFHAAEDADSEGEEGRFYVFTTDELIQVLGEENAALAAEVYNCQKEGNFLEEATGHATGANILHLAAPLEDLAPRLGMPAAHLVARLRAIDERLMNYRATRVRPHKDDKILADWNGLAIAALALGGRVLETPAYAQAAAQAADWIWSAMRLEDGRLFHRWREGEAAVSGLADDYASLAWGCLELHATLGEARWLERARALVDRLLEACWDQTRGGFFLAPHDAPPLLARLKEVHDAAQPSGNSIALWVLLHLAHRTGDARYREKADAMIAAFGPEVAAMPLGFTFFCRGLDLYYGGMM